MAQDRKQSDEAGEDYGGQQAQPGAMVTHRAKGHLLPPNEDDRECDKVDQEAGQHGGRGVQPRGRSRGQQDHPPGRAEHGGRVGLERSHSQESPRARECYVEASGERASGRHDPEKHQLEAAGRSRHHSSLGRGRRIVAEPTMALLPWGPVLPAGT